MRTRPALFSCTLLFAGCAASPAQRPDEPLIAGPADDRAPDPERPSRPAAASAPTTTTRAPAPIAAAATNAPAPVPLPAGPVGNLARADVDRVLAGSPGVFLASVDLDPVLDGRRFIGWRIRSLFAGDARFNNCALRPGDVVTRVNGLPVERPDQFAAAWDALRAADALSVEVLRDGRPGALTWRITPVAAPR